VATIVSVGFEVGTFVGLEVVVVAVSVGFAVTTVGFKVGISTADGSIVAAVGDNTGAKEELGVLPVAEDPKL
jgi:hypothetical protein